MSSLTEIRFWDCLNLFNYPNVDFTIYLSGLNQCKDLNTGDDIVIEETR